MTEPARQGYTMEQNIAYISQGKNPGALMGVITPIAAVSPHLFDVPLGQFYHSIAGALAAGTYTLQTAEFDGGKSIVGFAVWGKFNQVVAARFRCQPDALSVSDYTSGSIPVLIALSSPLSHALDADLRAHLKALHPDMHVPEITQ